MLPRRLSSLIGAVVGCSVRLQIVIAGFGLGLSILAFPVCAQTPGQPPDTMAARVEACTPCHGNQGEGTSDVYFPRLAGKPAGYLYNQLLAFKNGRRNYPPMNYLLEYLGRAVPAGDGGILRRATAAAAAAAARDASAGRAGARRRPGGPGRCRRGRFRPACSCHGPGLTGMEPGVPGLLGLRPNYISAQLGAWRYGTRTAKAPDCMQIVAAISPRRTSPRSPPGSRAGPRPINAAPAPKGPTRCRLPAAASRTEEARDAFTRHHASLACSWCRSLAVRRRAGAAAEGKRQRRRQARRISRPRRRLHRLPHRAGGPLFAGGRAMPTPFGTLYTSNITPDRETGIGSWTRRRFYRMMHTGRFPDGGLLYPAMPFASYTKVTRADSDAIFAYLKSIPPVNQKNRPHDLRFPYNNRPLILGWRTLFFTEGEYKPDPTKSAEWNRGAYLVKGLGHCGMCHTPINALGGSSQSEAFEGGLIPMQNWYAPSLTSNREGGLGDWSIKDITDLLKTGVSARGAVYGPMAEVVYNSLQYLTDDDTAAMAVYLKSLAAARCRAPPAGSAMPTRREQPAGQPRQDRLRPALRELPWRAGRRQAAALPAARRQPVDPDEIGRQPDPHGAEWRLSAGHRRQSLPYGMPPFAQTLSDNEVAAVVTYIRTAWGNRGAPVSAARGQRAALRTAELRTP